MSLLSFLFGFSFVAVSIFFFFDKEVLPNQIQPLNLSSIDYKFHSDAQSLSANRVKSIKAQMKMEPKSYKLQIELAQHLLAQAIYEDSNTHLDLAHAAAIKAQRLKALDPQAILLQGDVSLIRGMAKKSLRRANWVMSQSSTFRNEALLLRAKSFLHLNRLRAALKDAQLLLNTEFRFKALRVIAQVKGQQGHLQSAVNHYEKSYEIETVKDFEESLRSRQELATLLLNYGRYAHVERLLDAVDKMVKDESETLLLRAQVALQFENYEKASKWLEQSIEKKESFGKQRLMAKTLSALGQEKMSQRINELNEKAIRKEIRLGFHHEKLELAKLLLDKNQIQEAKGLLKRLSKNYESREVLHLKMKAYFMSGHEAFGDIVKKIRQRGPLNAEQLYLLGERNKQESRWVRAFLYFGQSLAINSNFKPESHGYAAFPWSQWIERLN